MDLGIVKTIRWVLGIDEELDQLRAQLANARTECDSKIEVLQSSLNSVGDRLVEESAILREEFKETSNNLDAKIKSADTHHTENYLTLRSQSEQTDFNLERKLNATSAEVSDLKDIVAPQRAPLLTAPFWNYTDVVAAKLTVNHDGKFGHGALDLAFQRWSSELIELLNKIGIDFTNKDEKDCDGLICFTIKNMQRLGVSSGDLKLKTQDSLDRWQYSIIKLLEHGLDPNSAFSHFSNLMQLAGAHGYNELIVKLHSLGTDINSNATWHLPLQENRSLCDRALTPLTWAVRSHNILTVTKLVDLGAEIRFKDMYGRDVYDFINKCSRNDGLIEFLNIIEELQAAYAEAMKSSVHVQIDGSVADHLEDVPLIGEHVS